MAEKILNTRVQLKYDSLTNWQNSAFNGSDASKYLKKGELAIITLGPNKETSPVNTANQHPLLFKVGTGAHKFDDLPFASALAADVYAWAKCSQVSFVDQKIYFHNEALNAEKTNAVKVLDLSTFVTEDELAIILNSYYTKTEADGKFALKSTVDNYKETVIDPILTGYVKSVDGKEAIDSTGGQNPEISLKIDTTSSGATGGTAVKLSQSNNGLKAEVNLTNYVQKDGDKVLSDNNYTDAEKTKLAGIATGATKVEASSTNGNIKIDGVEKTVYTHPAKHTVGEIDNFDAAVAAIKVTDAGHADTADYATEAGHAVSADNATNAGKLENRTTAELKAYLKEQFEGSIADGDTGFVTGDAVYDVKATADAAKARIDAFIEGTDDATTVIDTLVEIQEFMTADTGAFVALSERVSDIEDGTTTVPKATHAVNADEAGHATSADSADYAAEAGHASSADEATHAGSADNATEAEDSKKLGGQLPAYYATAASVTDITKAGGEIDKKIQALDATVTGMGAGKTIKTLTETDGIIAAEFQDIAITTEQITDYRDLRISDTTWDGTTTAGTQNHFRLVEKTVDENKELWLEMSEDLATAGYIGGDAVVDGKSTTPDYLTVERYGALDYEIGKQLEIGLTTSTISKIDGAVQTITDNCTANPAQATSGIKATRTGNSVNIEIDDSVTFIFNCGSATELV